MDHAGAARRRINQTGSHQGDGARDGSVRRVYGLGAAEWLQLQVERGTDFDRGTISLEAQENGTLVTVKGYVEASGITRLMEGLIIGRVEKQDQGNFNRLKRILEAD